MQHDDGGLLEALHVPLYPDQLFLASEARRQEALPAAGAASLLIRRIRILRPILPTVRFLRDRGVAPILVSAVFES
jgi:hypothetical protein